MKNCPECYVEYEDALEKCPDDGFTLKVIEKDPLIGTRLAERYEIVSVLGRGGMGVVYKVRQELMDRFMAVKMLHSHMVAEPEAVKRFFREAKTVSQVKHHHIVTLYDFGMSPQGQPFLVMDYLEGTSLKRILKDDGPLSLDRAVTIFKQVVEGLAAAHAQNVVHRDLKPENIMLANDRGQEDWVTLVDFGLSKLKEPEDPKAAQVITHNGDVCGSPPYMSPEQCVSSHIVDPRIDIYALAVVIYESLSNKLPFNVKSAIEMLDCHLYATPIPFNQTSSELKVCTELTRVFNHALEKEPGKRHQTIEEFGLDLHEALMRDSLKLRTLRHRAEVAMLQNLMGEAAVSAGRTTADKLDAVVRLSGPNYLMEQAQLESDMEDEREPGGYQSNASDSSRLTLDRNSKPDMGQSQAPVGRDKENVQDVVYEYCPHCDAELYQGLKFCLNCQRQLVLPQDLARLRSMRGRHTLSRSRKSDTFSTTRISERFRSASERTLQLARIQRILKGLLFLVIAYAIYIGLHKYGANVMHSVSTFITIVKSGHLRTHY